MKIILIDHPGAGAWIMEHIQGSAFNPDRDHSISSHDEDYTILGGFVTSGYTGRSVQVHMAGRDPRWCSRTLMWNLFNYVFNKLQVERAFATISTGNSRAIALDMRAGWKVETRVKGVYPDGDMLILYMEREGCPWMRLGDKDRVKHGREINSIGLT